MAIPSPANFTPTLSGYSGQNAFRFWCQKVLPLVYDDSLSYYELLNKMVIYLNNVISDVASVEGNVEALLTSYEQLQTYVNNWFNEAAPEVAYQALNRMAENGELDVLIQPFVETYVAENIDGVVAEQIDGAVAGQIDGAVGDQIGDTVAGQIDDVVGEQIGGAVSSQIGGAVAGQIDNAVAGQIDGAVSEQIGGAVSSQIGGVVANQIDNAVAGQIDDAVEGQIDGAVEDQIGDAVATPVTNWLNTNVTPVGSAVVVDKSLSVEGAAADAWFTGDTIEKATGNKRYVPASGYISLSSATTDFTVSSSENCTYTKIACSEGDQFTLTTSGSTNARAYGFADANGNIIEVAPASTSYTEKLLTAPADSAWLICNSYPATVELFVYKNELIKNKINKIDILTDKTYPIAKNVFNKDDPDIIDGGYINKNGTTVSSTDYFESGFIPCKPNDTIMCGHWNVGQTTALVITWYRANKTRIGATQSSYTVPFVITNTSAAYVRMCLPVARRNDACIYLNYAGKLSNVLPYNNYDFGMFDNTTSMYTKINNLETSNAAIDGRLTEAEGDISAIETATSGVPTLETTVASLKAFVDEHWRGKSWYAYGTSLTSTANGKYAPYVAQFSGLLLTNKGISGGALIANSRLKDALLDPNDGKVNADLITVEVGANDRSSAYGTIYDIGNDTFCGVLNQCIQYLQSATNAQIVVMTSTPSVVSTASSHNPTPPSTVYGNGMTMIQMNEMVREVCQCNGVYFIPMGDGVGYGYARVLGDGGYQSGVHPYRVDNIHHTELGGYNIAKGIWSYLKNIPLWYTQIPS